ncbi:hypothetical protein K502DRAFT_346623 [Neoconidiobolus thromboides FSU 785]|nr:hypothetical protein K502DRAFT_346623 [Neoconidiobolus thromboides FSU 785]
MDSTTLEGNNIYNQIDLNNFNNLIWYQRYKFQAFKIVDNYTFHYKTTLISTFYLIVLIFEFGCRFAFGERDNALSKDRSLLHLVFSILEIPFILLFLIELALKLFTLTNVKLYVFQLSVMDSSFLVFNIAASIFDIVKHETLSLEIKMLVAAARLLLQVYINKQVIEVIEECEDKITERYKEHYKSIVLKNETMKLINKALEVEVENYSKTISSIEAEVKELDSEMIETHRKSWGALVSPMLSVKVNIPVMNESSFKNQRKSKELKRTTEYRKRCNSFSNF